jgi:hypothetical protein
MLKKWQVFGQHFGETEKSESSAASRLLASAALIGAAIGGIVAILNGVTSLGWILGMTTLGIFLAIVAEIVDQVFHQLPVRQGSGRNRAAAATVLTYLFICGMIAVGLGLISFG